MNGASNPDQITLSNLTLYNNTQDINYYGANSDGEKLNISNCEIKDPIDLENIYEVDLIANTIPSANNIYHDSINTFNVYEKINGSLCREFVVRFLMLGSFTEPHC